MSNFWGSFISINRIRFDIDVLLSSSQPHITSRCYKKPNSYFNGKGRPDRTECSGMMLTKSLTEPFSGFLYQLVCGLIANTLAIVPGIKATFLIVD